MILIHREAETSMNEPGELIECSARQIQASTRTPDTFLQPGEYVVYVLSFMRFAEEKTTPATLVIHR